MTHASNPHPLCTFGPFRVDFETCEIHKHGIRLHVQSQPVRVLWFLVERQGQLVTRQELQAKLWPGHSAEEVDDSLNSTVKKLREALSDDAGKPLYIETIPRHGYRMLVPVEHSQPQELSSHLERIGHQTVHDFSEVLDLPSAATDFSSVAKPARLFYSVTEGWSFSFLMAVIVTLIVVSGLMSLVACGEVCMA